MPHTRNESSTAEVGAPTPDFRGVEFKVITNQVSFLPELPPGEFRRKRRARHLTLVLLYGGLFGPGFVEFRSSGGESGAGMPCQVAFGGRTGK